MRLSQKILFIAAIPVVFELTIFGVLWSMVEKLDQARRSEAHGRDMATAVNKLGILHMERATVLIMRAWNKDSYDMLNARAESLVDEINGAVRDIERLSAGYPGEYALCQDLKKSFQHIGQIFNSTTRPGTSGTEMSRRLSLLGLQSDMQKINQTIMQLSVVGVGDMQRKQDLLLRYDSELRSAIALSAGLSVFMALGLAIFLYRSTSSRFDRLTVNTARLAANQPPLAPVAGADEIAAIDKLCQELYLSLTQLRARERAVLDNAMDVVCSISEDLRFEEVNEAACRLWGYEKDELIGMRAVEVLQEGDSAKLTAALKQAKARQEKTKQDKTRQDKVESRSDSGASMVELAVRTFAGQIVETEWCITRSETDSGYYLVIHDISQRKQIERMKQEFASMVSHDLRTPLNSVLLSLELVLAEAGSGRPLSADAVKDLQACRGNISRLLSLVNNLLDIESISQGQMQLFKEPAKLADIFEAALASVQPLALKKNILIDSRLEGSYELECDQERIVQVLVNLLGNAVKFSPEGARVLVKGRKQGNHLRVEVRDRGRGIPEDKIGQVFDRFYQVQAKEDRGLKSKKEGGESSETGEFGKSGQTKISTQGTGLGLSICKNIVELHGGKIGVFAGEEGGCVFWFTIPCES